MKIVILDGHAVNPGDISWKPMEELGEVTVYDHTLPEDTKNHIGDAQIVLTNKTVIDKDIIESCAQIQYIGVLATGYNVVDLKAAAARNIPVTNIPAYSTNTVAQFTFGLILELCHHIGLHDASVKQGDWIASTDFCYWKTPMLELEGKTLGILGFGQIGKRVASIAESFGMNVLVHTPHPDFSLETDSLHFVSFEELLENSRILSLHCPLNEKTRGILNKDSLSLMQPGSMIINVARGPLIEEQALKEALESGHICGAACDVISEEPMKPENPLLTAPNIIITPHIAWASVEARTRLLSIASENIRSWQKGQPRNVVSSC